MNFRVNWIGFKTIVRKEVIRVARIWVQTIVPPAITMTLYFIIFGNLIGRRIEIHGATKQVEVPLVADDPPDDCRMVFQGAYGLDGGFGRVSVPVVDRHPDRDSGRVQGVEHAAVANRTVRTDEIDARRRHQVRQCPHGLPQRKSSTRPACAARCDLTASLQPLRQQAPPTKPQGRL